MFTEEQRTRGNGILCSEVFVSPVRETESDCFEKKILMAISFLEKMVINKFRETSYWLRGTPYAEKIEIVIKVPMQSEKTQGHLSNYP